MDEWRDIDTLPPPGHRPGKVWVIVEGYQTHSGSDWFRAKAGIARTDNDGIYADDVAAIEREDHMRPGSGKVTHWMPIELPPLPQYRRDI